MKRILCFICFLFLIGCVSLKKDIGYTNQRSIIFDKVKIAIDGFGLYGSAKGNVSVFHDSLITFKFWGPLGLDFLKGSYDKNLDVYCYLNDINYNGLESELESILDIRLNRQCFEYFITGAQREFISGLKEINHNISDSNLQILSDGFVLSHPFKDNFMEVHYKLYQGIVKEINIKVKRSEEYLHIHVSNFSFHLVLK